MLNWKNPSQVKLPLPQPMMGDFGYGIFSIRGKGSFQTVFQFIHYLENGPQLYQVDKISLHSLEIKDEKSGLPKLVLPFNMEIHAYFTDLEGLPEIKHTLADVRPGKAANPFLPGILKTLPANVNNLIEVENAEVVGIFTNRAMIRYNGETHILKRGEKVYLGYLSKIDPDNNVVVFKLNKGGIVERVTLKLEFSAGNK